MSQQTRRLYEFGPFCLDADDGRLLRDGRVVPLKPKVLETLAVLVEHGGRVVSKDELMRRLWPDSFVEEANLAVNVSQLRKALGDGEAYIETVPKRGYRFVPDVRALADDATLIVKERTRAQIIIEEETDEVAGPEQSIQAEALTVNAVPAAAHAPTPSSAAPRPARAGQFNQVWLVVAVAVVMTALSLAFGLYEYLKRGHTAPFQAMAVTKLTNDGKVIGTAISPDGKYVAYIESDGGQQSLWVKDATTGSTVQVLPPARVKYGAGDVTMDFAWLSFSPDGNYLYYSRSEKDSSTPALYKVAKLGGVPTKLLDDFGSAITFSPDGRQMAFIRNEQTGSRLSVANPDGSAPKTIATSNAPASFFSEAVAWSPDGNSIACVIRHDDQELLNMSIVAVRVSDGAVTPLTTRKWQWVFGLAWLRDGGGLLLTGADEAGWYHEQIYQVSYPSGEVRRITNDTNIYTNVSVAANADTLVSTQSNVSSSIWVLPNGDLSQARQISSGINDGLSGFAWTPDGRIVYPSLASGNFDLWIMDADGSNKRQLNADPPLDWCPAVTPDGRYIVFCSNRAGGLTLWRMDIDGRNLKQLTKGYDYTPQISPDGKWVVYTHADGGRVTSWKVGIDGGEPVQVTDKFSRWQAISPDGQLMAYEFWDEQVNSGYKIVVMPFAGGPPVRIFDYAPAIAVSGFMRWMPDGKALTYISMQNDARVWLQPLAGGPPRELLDFKDGRVWNINWSRDGKLLCSRGAITSDVVMISNFR